MSQLLTLQANEEISLWITLLFTLYYKTRIGKTEAINLLLLVKEFSNKAAKVKPEDEDSRLPQHTFELLITYLSIYDPNPGNFWLTLADSKFRDPRTGEFVFTCLTKGSSFHDAIEKELLTNSASTSLY